MPPISLPPDVDTSDKTPRVAIAFDRTSGVRQLPDKTVKVLLIGQLATGAAQAPNVIVDLLRETDSELLFKPGSVLDVAAKAAFKAYDLVQLSAIGVADPGGGVAAMQTVTFTGTATEDCQCVALIGNRTVTSDILTGDTPTVAAAAFVAAVNAIDDLPVTAANVAGVVTLTLKNKGTIGNGLSLSASLSSSTATITVAVGGAKFAGGTGVADISAALAALGSSRHHLIPLLLDDATSGQAERDYLDTEGDAEHGQGQVGMQAVVGTLSTATTLAGALNGVRSMVWAVNGTPSWYPEVVAAAAAVMSSEQDPARPLNTLVLNGIAPPPIDKRWTRTELKNLLNNGVSPLVVLPGEKVAILRAVSTAVKNAQGNPDYSVFDITIIRSFDYLRDAMTLMFNTLYARSKWADDDPDGLLPPDVATPFKVKTDMLGVLRDLERSGIVQQVEALKDQLVVQKVGTNAQFSLPADFVDGLHEILGKVVLIKSPFAA